MNAMNPPRVPYVLFEVCKMPEIDAEQARQPNPRRHRHERSGQSCQKSLFHMGSKKIDDFNRNYGKGGGDDPMDGGPQKNKHARKRHSAGQPRSTARTHNQYGQGHQQEPSADRRQGQRQEPGLVASTSAKIECDP
jgi:hypothetical protein